MHNALQGDDINLTELKKMQIYEEVALENAVRSHIDHDVIIVHDPQPLPLIRTIARRCRGFGVATSISRVRTQVRSVDPLK